MRRHVLMAVLTSALVIGPTAWAQSPAPSQGAVAASQDAKVQEILQICFDCHGKDGVSRLPTRPTIAGQKADYLTRQMLAFQKAGLESIKDGDADADNAAPATTTGLVTRTDPVMAHMIDGLDGAMLNVVVATLAAMPCDGGQRGKDIANPPPMPDVARRCMACHGTQGQGIGAPNLAGQQKAYLRRQLLLLRETAFGAEPRENESWRRHPIMEREAGRLSIEDVDAVAGYFSNLDCRVGQ